MEIEGATNMQFMTEIVDPSQAGEARRAAVKFAESIGMTETDCGNVAIAVTEMATNLFKHAGHGKIICAAVTRNQARGLCVLALDKGPGIPNISAAMQDGYSTYGSSGNGLGAVRRLSTVFDLYSAPAVGTSVLAEFWPNKKSSATPIALGVVSLAMRGESVCGDGWGSRAREGRSFFMVVDGLGHGTFAAEAAREAERVLADSNSTSVTSILRDFHDALKKTRGAAAAIAEISQDKGTLTYAGIGNISAVMINGHSRHGIASHNGTLGHHMHKLQEFTVPWNSESILIMHSDGLGSKWDLSQYPGLAGKHPTLIAATLYRDFLRERDDVTVMAAKNTQ
jgi:anti-sigma regulatory factor (Ser/Thr protein kinase)